ncbi:hypothetical protein HYU07_02340 [Candidatus Woesearchaeota archaeon]|nr:hypothetical protein [Candidatus Woesearchaeota archaeon]
MSVEVIEGAITKQDMFRDVKSLLNGLRELRNNYKTQLLESRVTKKSRQKANENYENAKRASQEYLNQALRLGNVLQSLYRMDELSDRKKTVDEAVKLLNHGNNISYETNFFWKGTELDKTLTNLAFAYQGLEAQEEDKVHLLHALELFLSKSLPISQQQKIWDGIEPFKGKTTPIKGFGEKFGETIETVLASILGHSFKIEDEGGVLVINNRGKDVKSVLEKAIREGWDNIILSSNENNMKKLSGSIEGLQYERINIEDQKGIFSEAGSRLSKAAQYALYPVYPFLPRAIKREFSIKPSSKYAEYALPIYSVVEIIGGAITAIAGLTQWKMFGLVGPYFAIDGIIRMRQMFKNENIEDKDVFGGAVILEPVAALGVSAYKKIRGPDENREIWRYNVSINRETKEKGRDLTICGISDAASHIANFNPSKAAWESISPTIEAYKLFGATLERELDNVNAKKVIYNNLKEQGVLYFASTRQINDMHVTLLSTFLNDGSLSNNYIKGLLTIIHKNDFSGKELEELATSIPKISEAQASEKVEDSLKVVQPLYARIALWKNQQPLYEAEA